MRSNHMEDCIFCKIISKKIPAKPVFEDDDVLVINDINPKAKVHVLVMPKKHLESLADAQNNNQELLGKLLLICQKMAKQLGIGNGFKVAINNGKDAGQEVPHLHLHLLGGWKN